MSTLEDRLIELRGSESVAAFAKKCEIQENTMRLYFSGSIPSLDKAQRIAGSCGISLEWLATGKNPKFNTDNLKMDSGALKIDIFELPLSAKVASLTECENSIFSIMLSAELVKSFDLPSKSFGIVVKGDSMSPKLCGGDIVVMDGMISKIEDDGIYLFNCDNSVFLKQLQRTGKNIIIKSLNTDYEDWAAVEKDITIIAKMRLLLKKA